MRPRDRLQSGGISVAIFSGPIPRRPSRARQLLATEQRQHALVRSLSRIETEASGERALQNPHLIAHVKHFAFWKPDQPVTLARSDLVDRAVGHARWLRTIEHSANHAGRPAGGVPLKLDGDEAVPGKQWRCD